VKPEVAAQVAERLRSRGMDKLGERGEVTPAMVERILLAAA
jgi:hypothetical protein